MSSNSFAATLDLRLRPSARAHHALFLLHGLPLLLLPVSMQPGLGMTLVAMGIGGSWLWLRRHPAFGYGPRAIRRMVWQADDCWTSWLQDGRELSATLDGRSYLHPRLTILNFLTPGQPRRTRVLLGDEAEPELLKRLLARLSVSRVQAEG